jgi:hypothetical protein
MKFKVKVARCMQTWEEKEVVVEVADDVKLDRIKLLDKAWAKAYTDGLPWKTTYEEAVDFESEIELLDESGQESN